MSEQEERAKNIYQRINDVRRSIAYVQKDSNVDGKYLGVRYDAVVAIIRDAVIDAGVIIVTDLQRSEIVQDTGMVTKFGTPIIRYEATYTVSLINEDDPAERFKITVEAHANDTGDKAPGKAASYAVKIVLLKLFLLESGEDEEQRVEGEPPKLTAEHHLSLIAKCEKLGFNPDEALEALAVKVYKLERIEDAPDQWYQDMMRRLEKRGKKQEEQDIADKDTNK